MSDHGFHSANMYAFVKRCGNTTMSFHLSDGRKAPRPFVMEFDIKAAFFDSVGFERCCQNIFIETIEEDSRERHYVQSTASGQGQDSLKGWRAILSLPT